MFACLAAANPTPALPFPPWLAGLGCCKGKAGWALPTMYSSLAASAAAAECLLLSCTCGPHLAGCLAAPAAPASYPLPSLTPRLLLQGLLHLHSRGLVHRDVKPPNLLIDAGWRCKASGTAWHMVDAPGGLALSC